MVIRKDLREVSMGEWEGCAFGDIAQRFPEEFKARGSDIISYRVPGGESFADCHQRVIAALEDNLALAPAISLSSAMPGEFGCCCAICSACRSRTCSESRRITDA